MSWYYPLERLHAIFTFPLIFFYFSFNYPLKDILLLEYGLLVCIFILFQGQHYWKLKLYSLKAISFDKNRNVQLFKKSRTINAVLIIFMPIVLLLQLSMKAWTVGSPQLMIGALMVNVFAILEHVNYYHTQLMVDNRADFDYVVKNKRLKTASLKKDLLENNI